MDEGDEPPEDFCDVPHAFSCTSAFAHSRLVKEVCRQGLQGWVDVDVVNSVFSQFEANFEGCPGIVKEYNHNRDGFIADVFCLRFAPETWPRGCSSASASWAGVVVAAKQSFRSTIYEFTCHVFHPKSTALFTPPFTASHRARLVVAAPSSPCCRARVIDADAVIASTWPPSSPCRRAVVPAPSVPASS